MTLWIPATFWDDHSERFPTGSGGCDAEETARAGNRVKIDATPEQLRHLFNDAEFYTDRDGPDGAPANVVRSAAATLKALRRAAGVERERSRGEAFQLYNGTTREGIMARATKTAKRAGGRPRNPRPAGLLGNLGARVEAVRERRGFSQLALAEAAGVGLGTLGAIERGGPGKDGPCLSTVVKIAAALGMTARELMQAVEGW